MKLKKDLFRAAIEKVSPFCKSGKIYPSLDNVKIEISQGELRLTGYDNKTGIIEILPADIFIPEETEKDIRPIPDLSLLLSPIDLSKILKLIPDDTIDIEPNDDKTICKITYNAGVLEIPLFPIADYPDLPNLSDNTESVLLDKDNFEQIEKAGSFALMDPLRPALGGICLNLTENNADISGSDSHELFFDSLKTSYKGQNRELLIDKDVITAIPKAIGSIESLSLTFDDSYMRITQGNTTIISRLINAKYPNVKSVIPKDNNIHISIKKELLESAINRMLIACDKSSPVVRLSFSNNELAITSENLSLNKSGHEVCPFTGDCENSLTIGVSGYRFLDCIKGIDADMVDMEIKDADHALILKDGENPNSIILLMPCKLLN